MKLNILLPAVAMACLLGQAHAAEYRIDFSIESADPTLVGTAPYGLPSDTLDLHGTFMAHENLSTPDLSGNFFGSIDSLDFTAGSRIYTIADVHQSPINVLFNGSGVPFRFGFSLDTALDDFVGYNENGSTFVLNGATANTIFCDGCVAITSAAPVGVSAVPLPATAPLFGAGLLALGAVGWHATRKAKPA